MCCGRVVADGSVAVWSALLACTAQIREEALWGAQQAAPGKDLEILTRVGNCCAGGPDGAPLWHRPAAAGAVPLSSS